MTLEEIQGWFPNAHYAPDPNCKRCGGEGKRDLPPEKAKKFKYLKTTDLPCPCIFFGPDTDELVGLLNEAVQQIRQGEKT